MAVSLVAAAQWSVGTLCLNTRVCGFVSGVYRIGGSAVRNGRRLKLLKLAGRSGSHKVVADAIIVREVEEYTLLVTPSPLKDGLLRTAVFSYC